MTEIVCASIAALATIVCAVIAGKSATERKRAEDRFTIRERESRISMSLMFATSKLCVGTAMALINNGEHGEELNEGLDAVSSAQKEYEEFLMDVTASRVSR